MWSDVLHTVLHCMLQGDLLVALLPLLFVLCRPMFELMAAAKVVPHPDKVWNAARHRVQLLFMPCLYLWCVGLHLFSAFCCDSQNCSCLPLKDMKSRSLFFSPTIPFLQVEKGGEDAYLISDIGAGVICVADGVGG